MGEGKRVIKVTTDFITVTVYLTYGEIHKWCWRDWPVAKIMYSEIYNTYIGIA